MAKFKSFLSFWKDLDFSPADEIHDAESAKDCLSVMGGFGLASLQRPYYLNYGENQCQKLAAIGFCLLCVLPQTSSPIKTPAASPNTN